VVPAAFSVVLDANVLFPFTLRDTLLRAAAADLYQLHWSDEILDEVARNLVATKTTTEEQAVRLVATMRRAFPEAMITGHESLVAAMPNQEKDRHVAAAAVRAGAQVVVTSNLRDFREMPDGVEAQSPDEFLCNLFDLDPDGMVTIVRDQAQALRRPARTFEEVCAALERIVPSFVTLVRQKAADESP
jgi:predicted nucleic acid-binding protein